MGTHSQNKRDRIENDNMSDDAFSELLKKSIRNMLDVCKGVFYICMGSKELGSMKNIFESEGGHWQSFIIWVKNTFTLSRSDWQNQYEPILYGWNKDTVNHYFAGWRNEANVWEDLEELNPVWDGEKTKINLGEYHLELDQMVTGRVISKKHQTDIWREKKPTKNPEHPTMKPVRLIAKAIKASSVRNQTVLDIFGGSGSTLIACEELDRRCLMMELDPKYVDVIRKRYERFVKSRNS
jgi:DNA modification methylase